MSKKVAEKPEKTEQSNETVSEKMNSYFLPEFGVSVKAKSIEEAVAKAKKEGKK